MFGEREVDFEFEGKQYVVHFAFSWTAGQEDDVWLDECSVFASNDLDTPLSEEEKVYGFAEEMAQELASEAPWTDSW